jgi:hypothetical protein
MNLLSPKIKKIALSLLVMLAATPILAQTRIAVIELNPSAQLKKETTGAWSELLRSAFLKTGKFTVITREEMQRLLMKGNFPRTIRCDETSLISRMGKFLGVTEMIAGRVDYDEGQFMITLNRVGVANKKVLTTIINSTKCPAEKLDGEVQAAVKALVDGALKPPHPFILPPKATKL